MSDGFVPPGVLRKRGKRCETRSAVRTQAWIGRISPLGS
jgi:hypothetical protein